MALKTSSFSEDFKGIPQCRVPGVRQFAFFHIDNLIFLGVMMLGHAAHHAVAMLIQRTHIKGNVGSESNPQLFSVVGIAGLQIDESFGRLRQAIVLVDDFDLITTLSISHNLKGGIARRPTPTIAILQPNLIAIPAIRAKIIIVIPAAFAII
jgi:hypothetical protein